jgi:hypothetical protein
MKVAMVTGSGRAEIVDTDRPQIGPRDVLVRMRACGICGSDAFYIAIGGIPLARDTCRSATSLRAKSSRSAPTCPESLSATTW